MNFEPITQNPRPMTADDLLELTSEQLLWKMDEIRHAADDIGKRWAKLNKEYKDFKELMPSYLATIQSSFLTEGDGVQEARVKALATQTYQERLRAMNACEFEAEKVYVEYRALMASLEALKSIAFVKNQELKTLR